MSFDCFLAFVQAQYGPLLDHDFEESINGVFRQARSGVRISEQPAKVKLVQKKKNNNGQQSIDKFCVNKSGSNTKQKAKQVSTRVMSGLNNSDEDDDDSF